MSHVDDLIAEFCPHGVDSRPLSELVKYVRGVTYAKSDEEPGGPIRVLRSNNITLASNTLNFKDVKHVSAAVKVRPDQLLRANDILISAASGSKAHVGKVAFIERDINFVLGGFMAVIRANRDLAPRFLFHLLVGNGFANYLEAALTSTTINNLTSTTLGNFFVPVPPLEVQGEIVRALDNFMELVAELEAELGARRRQYAFYLDQLLGFRDAPGVRSLPIGEFAVLVRGNGMPKADLTAEGVPAIHYGQIYTHYGTWATQPKSYVADSTAAKLAKVDSGDIVITNTSENLNDVGKAVAWLGDRSAVTGGHATVIKHGENPKFLAYYFQTAAFDTAKRKLATGTKVIDVSANALAKIEIPLPPRAEQDRIVSVLDKFDALVNDISVGLPAELAARRKQYEYYRQKLLTFPESVA